jgi:hypothetical protein
MLLDSNLLINVLRILGILVGILLLCRAADIDPKGGGFDKSLRFHCFMIGLLNIYISVVLPKNVPVIGDFPFFEYYIEKIAAYVLLGSLADIYHPPIRFFNKKFNQILSKINKLACICAFLVLMIGLI